MKQSVRKRCNSIKRMQGTREKLQQPIIMLRLEQVATQSSLNKVHQKTQRTQEKVQPPIIVTQPGVETHYTS